MKKISRRNFIRSTAASALGLAAVGALTACSGSSSSVAASSEAAASEAASLYTAGTYTATAQGIGEVTVTMTFDANSITDVQVDVSNETESIGGAIGEDFAKAILDSQGAEVDAVSGATVTSKAINTAAQDCINQAKGVVVDAASAATTAATGNTNPNYNCRSMDWLGEAPQIASSEIVATYDYDVVVVGGGHAGVLAALAAADDGVSVGVIESQSEDAWTVLGEDIGQWNSQWAIDHGFGPYNVGEVVNEFSKRSAGRVNPRLIKSYVENSGPAFDRLVEITEATGDPNGILNYSTGEDSTLIVQVQKDVTHYPIESCGYKTWATTAQFVGEISHETIMGCASRSNLPILEGNAVEVTKQEGAEWYYDTKAVVLVQNDNGDVTGVIAQGKDGYVQFNASKGVIMCTGDFGGNADMNWNLLGEASEWQGRSGGTGDNWITAFGGSRDGSGHKMCCWAGGMVEPSPRGTMNIGGGPTGPWGTAPFMWINANGDRFTNEGAVAQVMGTVSRQPLGLMATITDANWMKNMCAAGLEHGGPNYGRPVYYDEMEEDMAKVLDAGAEGYSVRGCTVIERNASTVYGANDLDTLLGYLGYEGEAKENALASIERYNELCAKGVDEDFGRDTGLVAIDTPPYYGIKGNNSFSSNGLGLVTLAGIMTDDHQNVLASDMSTPIKGLYVCGNVLGGRYGIGYTTPCAGNSIGWAMASGWAAGHYVAAL
jgi:uncharacterized protein with FMN-binding domain